MSRVLSTSSVGSKGGSSGSNIELSSDCVNALFLVWFLADVAKKSKGRCQDKAQTAISFIIQLTECVAKGNSAPAWCPFELLFKCHFSKYGDGFVKTRGLFHDDEAKAVFGELGLVYPVTLVGTINNPAFSLAAIPLFAVMMRLGKVPFNMMCALAGLIEDGLRRRECVFVYKPTKQVPGAARASISRMDRKAAYDKFLGNTTHGIRYCMQVPEEEYDVQMPAPTIRGDLLVQETDANDSEDGSTKASTQLCPLGETPAKKKHYRRIVEEGSLLL